MERRDPAEDGSHDEDSEGIDEDDDAEDEKGVEEGDQDEEDEENDDGSDEENEDEEATNALRKALEEAVGMKGVNADDGESSDAESDEESMDDEQMMQIDEKLAAVFRSRVEERKKGKSTSLHQIMLMISVIFTYPLKILVLSEKQHTSRTECWTS